MRDLLGKDHSKKMELKESPDRGVYVKDLSQFVCKNYEEMNKVLKVGPRRVGTRKFERAMGSHVTRAYIRGLISILILFCMEFIGPPDQPLLHIDHRQGRTTGRWAPR